MWSVTMNKVRTIFFKIRVTVLERRFTVFSPASVFNSLILFFSTCRITRTLWRKYPIWKPASSKNACMHGCNYMYQWVFIRIHTGYCSWSTTPFTDQLSYLLWHTGSSILQSFIVSKISNSSVIILCTSQSYWLIQLSTLNWLNRSQSCIATLYAYQGLIQGGVDEVASHPLHLLVCLPATSYHDIIIKCRYSRPLKLWYFWSQHLHAYNNHMPYILIQVGPIMSILEQIIPDLITLLGELLMIIMCMCCLLEGYDGSGILLCTLVHVN